MKGRQTAPPPPLRPSTRETNARPSTREPTPSSKESKCKAEGPLNCSVRLFDGHEPFGPQTIQGSRTARGTDERCWHGRVAEVPCTGHPRDRPIVARGSGSWRNFRRSVLPTEGPGLPLEENSRRPPLPTRKPTAGRKNLWLAAVGATDHRVGVANRGRERGLRKAIVFRMAEGPPASRKPWQESQKEPIIFVGRSDRRRVGRPRLVP